MTQKKLLRPDRQRQIPPHFSWVDHRLIRQHRLGDCGHCAWALYLFLVSVGVKAWASPWGVPAGPIGVRVHVRPDRAAIYYGTLDNTVELRGVPRENLRSVAKPYWVKKVEPLGGDRS